MFGKHVGDMRSTKRGKETKDLANNLFHSRPAKKMQNAQVRSGQCLEVRPISDVQSEIFTETLPRNPKPHRARWSGDKRNYQQVPYYGLLASLLGARTLLVAPGLTTSNKSKRTLRTEQRASLRTERSDATTSNGLQPTCDMEGPLKLSRAMS